MKKTLLKSLMILAMASAIFTGCGGTKQPDVQDVYVDPELKGAPKWVMMPMVPGYVSEVGSAARNAGNSMSFQRDTAMTDARNNIAKQLSVKVGASFKSFTSTTGTGKASTFDNANERVSKQIANQTLRGTIVKDTWISRSGTLYVLMIIDTKTVEDMMDRTVKTSFKNDKAMYAKFLASKAQGELAKDLEAFNK